MSEDQLLEAAGNVTTACPIATPVFDGAKEADVNDALRPRRFRRHRSVGAVRRSHG